MSKKLQYAEVATLLYFFIRSSFIGIGINSYLHFGKVDSYLCIFFGAIIGILPVLLFLSLSNIQKEKSMLEIINHIVGKKLSFVINFFLMLFTLFYASVLFYDVINFIGSEYLYKTPPILIGIVLLIPIIYLLSKDLKTLTRTSIILFLLSFTLYIFSLIGLIPNFECTNLLPFLENGPKGVFYGSLAHAAYTSLPLFLFFIIPKKEFQLSHKKFILTFFVIHVFLLITMTAVIGVLGIDLSLLYQYPDYQVLRRIQVGGFIQRTESILAIQWILCLFIMICFCIYYVLTTLSFLFPKQTKKKKRSLLFLLPILTLILARNTFQNNTQFVDFTIHTLPFFLFLFFFMIPLFVFIFYKIKKT